MFLSPENYVRIAIAKAGGPTKCSNELSLSNGCIHSWIRKGRVPDLDYAKKLSAISGIKVDLLRPVL